MSENHFDLVVIGGGPAGYAAALYAGGADLSVAVVERDKIGGTCLHRGCIPAKELLETAAVHRTVSEAGEFGVLASAPGLDFSVTQARKQRIIDGLAAGVEGLLKRRKVVTFAGTGRLGAGRTVTVTADDGSQQVITGERVLLAAGSVPRTIPGFEIDGRVVLTSDEVLQLPAVPASAAVIGGGAIGCEFASMMSDLGSSVTILEYAPQIVPGVDADIGKLLARSFSERDIDVVTGVRVDGHTPQPGGGTTVHVEGGEDIDVDVVIVSVGRRPYGDHLGLEGTGVESDDRGFVIVDEYCRTGEPGVYALGDLVDTPQLAHVGFAEAIMVVKDILDEDPVPIDYAKVPWAIYCHPEVAFAGLTEEQAREAGHDVVVSKHRYTGNSRAMIVNQTDGMVKIIAARGADGRAGQILGVHMMGPWVTEQLGQGYLAVNWEATVDEVATFIQPHPTLSELFGETVLDLTGRALHG
ncbi:MAG: dihydrolipoyl dehydrogenase [Actinomycetota bacterium]|jgi:dihydrolipoamide dehydrogenase|nr:dihydrolipoyl dehydrogenase [Actinomycetota bacterium]